MGLDSHRGADNGDGRSARARRYRIDSHDWDTQPDPVYDSPPHHRDPKVHSSRRRTSLRRAGSSSRSLDVPDSVTMPPPPPLARSSTDVYRRPRNWMAYDDGRDSVAGRRRSRRDASPTYDRRDYPSATHSAYSSASGLAYGDANADRIEVVEEADDEVTTRRGRRQSSRDDYMSSSAGTRYHRRRRRRYDDDENEVVRTRHSLDDEASPTRESSRTADLSGSSRQGLRHMPNVIEDSRPPVSSQRSLVKRRHRSAEVIQHDDRPRRSSTVRSSRSRAGSFSGGPSGILGSIFGTPPSRRGSPDRHAREPRAAPRVECVICMGDISLPKAAKLKCGHAMCRACLERIFKLSITDPQHMPPKCCSQEHIPLKHVDRLFDSKFKKTWNRKFAEYSTKNRLYCPSRKCGEWIKPANIRRENGRKVARCSRCRTKICGICNGKWHGSDECPKDEETARLLAQAKEEGWKRCYRCKAVVELKEGCNHMTCRCGAEFCMICGVKWKGCDCPWFNDGSFTGDFLEHMNVPMPQIRGDLRDIFDSEGPPAPAELRDSHPVTMPMRMRPRPRSYHEEMLVRQLQERRDAEVARNLQHSHDVYDEHDMMGGVGDIHGIGNASGHYMNDNYRRGGGRYMGPMQGPPRGTGLDRGADYVADVGRARGHRGDSLERRLVDRMSESRSGTGMRVPVMTPLSPPISPPMPSQMRGPPMGTPGALPGAPPGAPIPVEMIPRTMAQGRGGLRHHSLEEELYNRSPHTPRSERVVGGRMSRNYQDEADIHAPRGTRQRPRSSDMAGLSSYGGQGMGRVSQWRTYVEPGIPDGESVVGHA